MIVWSGATFILRWSCLDSSFGRLCFFRINKNICFQAWTEINGGNNSIQGIVVEKCFLSFFTSYRIYINEWPWIQQHFTCIKSKACLQNPVCILYIHRSVVTHQSFHFSFFLLFSHHLFLEQQAFKNVHKSCFPLKMGLTFSDTALLSQFGFFRDIDAETFLVSWSVDHQGCIFRLRCSYPELTEDHVLTSAYMLKFLEPSREMP